MALRKIKISQLDEETNYLGSYTIGTNAANISKKFSLSFIHGATVGISEAIADATQAAIGANQSKADAEAAALDAEEAAQEARDAIAAINPSEIEDWNTMLNWALANWSALGSERIKFYKSNSIPSPSPSNDGIWFVETADNKFTYYVVSGGDLFKLDAVSAQDLEDGLDTKSDVEHTHEIEEVIGLETALDEKIPLTQKGANNGVATLGANGKIPNAQLPSAVFSVEEFPSFGSFPSTGQVNKIYIDGESGQIFKWSPSGYEPLNSADVEQFAAFFVRFDAVQTLSTGQKTTARTNIGAAADELVVKLSGNQTISGAKGFSQAPSAATDAATPDQLPRLSQVVSLIGDSSLEWTLDDWGIADSNEKIDFFKSSSAIIPDSDGVYFDKITGENKFKLFVLSGSEKLELEAFKLPTIGANVNRFLKSQSGETSIWSPLVLSDISDLTRGSIVQGTGTTITGTLANRLIGTGNVTFGLDTTYADGRFVRKIGDAMTGTINFNTSANSGFMIQYDSGHVLGMSSTNFLISNPTPTTGGAVFLRPMGRGSSVGELVVTIANQLHYRGNAFLHGIGGGGEDIYMRFGTSRSASGNAYIDLVGDTTYSTYGLRIRRYDTGVNAISEITHRGTGNLQISTSEAGGITFLTTNTRRGTILANGNWVIQSSFSDNGYKLQVDSGSTSGNGLWISGKSITSIFESGNALFTGTVTANALTANTTSTDLLVRGSGGLLQYRTLANLGGFSVADKDNVNQFSIALGENIRFEGGGDIQIAFNSSTRKVIITSIAGSGSSGVITSVFGRTTSAIVAVSGDYNTSLVTENSGFLYFTEARVRNTVLTGYIIGANTAIASTDNILQAFGKIQRQLNNSTTSLRSLTINGTSGRISVIGGTQTLAADRTWSVDLMTSGITVGTYSKLTVDVYGRATVGANLLISELGGTSIATPSTGQLLRYNGTNWVNWTPDFITSASLSGYVTTNTPQTSGLTGNKTWSGEHIFTRSSSFATNETSALFSIGGSSTASIQFFLRTGSNALSIIRTEALGGGMDSIIYHTGGGFTRFTSDGGITFASGSSVKIAFNQGSSSNVLIKTLTDSGFADFQVNGTIQQSVVSSLLKADSNGVLISAIAGVDYISSITPNALLTRGVGLTGNNYNGSTATTWAFDTVFGDARYFSKNGDNINISGVGNVRAISVLSPEWFSVISTAGTVSLNWWAKVDGGNIVNSNASLSPAGIVYASGDLYIRKALASSIGTTISWNSSLIYTSGNHIHRTDAQNDTRYLQANQNITLLGAVTGSGTTSITTTLSDNSVVTSKILNSAVTFVKIQNIATQSFLGRNTTGTGDVESLSAAQVRSMLSINNVDNTTDLLKPISTATQAALNLKQNTVSIPTSTLMGRYSAGTGAFQNITIGTGLVLNSSGVLSSSASVAIPSLQIAYGSGTSITSNANFAFNESRYVQIGANSAVGTTGVNAFLEAPNGNLLLQPNSSNRVIVDRGIFRVNNLSGSGDRMVIANSTGDLSTQTIPVSTLLNERIAFGNSSNQMTGEINLLFKRVTGNNSFYIEITNNQSNKAAIGAYLNHAFLEAPNGDLLLQSNSSYNVISQSNFRCTGSGFFQNGVTFRSDINEKKEIVLFKNGLESIRKIGAYSWAWKDGSGNDYGLISQQVREIMPFAVKDIKGVLTLNYNAMHALTIQSIKEIDTEVEQLKKRVKYLEDKLYASSNN